jgi:enoyl-CoA hydratase
MRLAIWPPTRLPGGGADRGGRQFRRRGGHCRDRTQVQRRRGHGPPQGALGAIRAFPKPLIAAVDGFALGGGFELALMADVMVLGPTARLGLPETNLGLIPGAGGGQRLMALAGRARAMRMVLTGEIIDARRPLTGASPPWLSEGPGRPRRTPRRKACRPRAARPDGRQARPHRGRGRGACLGRRARGVRGTPRHGRQGRRHPRLPRPRKPEFKGE